MCDAMGRRVVLLFGALVFAIAGTAWAQDDDASADFEWRAIGGQVYAEYCSACHGGSGSGVEGAYPALDGNPFVTSEDVHAVVHLPLFGRGGMPSLGGSLDNEQVAAVVNFIRTSWDNDASTIGPDVVAEVREEGSQVELDGSPQDRPGAGD